MFAVYKVADQQSGLSTCFIGAVQGSIPTNGKPIRRCLKCYRIREPETSQVNVNVFPKKEILKMDGT